MDCSPHALAQPLLPPGFRFHPTDEELLVHYLKKKTSSCPIPVPIMAEIDLYKFDPWELPSKANFGEREWYFFSPRDRKYPNGTRPNRAAASGYWKATGTDKPILTCDGTQKIGVKKALVFYGGKPPKGIKTNWIMHEYRLTDGSSRPSPFIVRKSLRLDDWVLCRVYMKNNHSPRISGRDQEDSSCVEEVLASLPDIEDPKLNILPRLGSIGGFSSEPEAFFDNFLNDGTTEADTSSLAEEESSLPTRNASNLNFTNPSLIPRNATFVPAGFFPKLESIEMDSSNFDLTSLKRCAPNTFKDEGHHTKRSFMLNNLSQFTQMMLPLQQQQKPHAILGGDMGSTLRFPFSDGRQKN